MGSVYSSHFGFGRNNSHNNNNVIYGVQINNRNGIFNSTFDGVDFDDFGNANGVISGSTFGDLHVPSNSSIYTCSFDHHTGIHSGSFDTSSGRIYWSEIQRNCLCFTRRPSAAMPPHTTPEQAYMDQKAGRRYAAMQASLRNMEHEMAAEMNEELAQIGPRIQHQVNASMAGMFGDMGIQPWNPFGNMGGGPFGPSGHNGSRAALRRRRRN